VHDDRRRLGELEVAVDERRDRALRIDGEVLGRLVLALGEGEALDVVFRADLLEHPASASRTSVLAVVELHGFASRPAVVPRPRAAVERRSDRRCELTSRL
jgi:hypothetical protein